MNIVSYIENKVITYNPRSKWNSGVKEYALTLVGFLQNGVVDGWIDLEKLESGKLFLKACLNGADSWHHYSWSGCSLIYNEDICKRLATASEQRRTKNGRIPPNKHEEWLDTQARALYQAYNLIDQFRKEWIKEQELKYFNQEIF